MRAFVRWFGVALLVAARAVEGQAGGSGPTARSASQVTTPEQRVEQAARDWKAGRYDVALASLAEVLRAPGADSLLPVIAQLTGEPYRTIEVAREHHNANEPWRPRWAGDNRHVAFEVGAGAALRTHVAQIGDSIRRLFDVAGTGLVFSPDARRVAYLEPRAAAGAGAPPPAPLVQVRDVGAAASEPATPLETSGLTFSELVFSFDGATLFGVGRAANATASQIYAWRGVAGAPVALTRSDSTKAELKVVSGGRHLVYGIRAGPTVGGGRGGGGGAGAGNSFEVLDVITGAVRRISGRNVSVARESATLVYLAGGAAGAGRGGGGRGGVGGAGGAQPDPVTSVMRLTLVPPGEPQTVYSTRLTIANPAVSPNGTRIAFEMIPRENRELYTMTVGDSVPARLTFDIQHDLSPQFLTNSTLLGMIGEARHRRAHVYDFESRARTKIFHNNTVRTIAPEYDWVPSPNGSKVLVVAERDGDTVTPNRWLYVTDLSRPVTRATLTHRVDSALVAERALRAFATSVYRPIEAAVRAAVDEVDVGRIYEYARTLYGFESKHIFAPGNALARDYLLRTYRSFGYDAKLQEFDTPAGGGGGRGGAIGSTVRTANVLAVLPGTEDPELVYVVGSHFDSVLGGPGADDNSSGTTALLEAARVLAQRPQPATIIFVSFTGEEAGLRGSREFVRVAQRDSMKLVGALNNDMLGFANDERLDNTIRYSNTGIRDVQHAAALRFTNLITYDAFYYKSTDAAAFYDAYGDIVGGIGSYPVLGNPHYHQSHDVLETINQQLVAEVSKTTVASLMLLASSPSRLAGLTATRAQGATNGALEVRWTPSPERSVVRYIVGYTPPGGARRQVTVTAPNARLTDAPPGTAIEVKAVNRRGLEGWDWARITAQ